MTLHPLDRTLCKPRAGQRFVAGGRDYELAGEIGDGAVGLVRKARDLELGRLVAVKFLAPDGSWVERDRFDDVSRRFRREGQRGAELRHENLVEVIAFEDNSDGHAFRSGTPKNPFIVMEFVQGTTLESLIGRLQGSSGGVHITVQTLTIAMRIAHALLYLHQRKHVHRDVKPANIFLSSASVGSVPSIVKLGDFGFTKWADFRTAITSGVLTATAHQGLGTWKYMSPEQATRPKDVTVRSDMFSFGITLFELFTGRILPSPHHVFELMRVRAMRASITGKLLELGIRCGYGEEELFNTVLDLCYQGPESRPTSQRMAGNLEYYLERLTEVR